MKAKCQNCGTRFEATGFNAMLIEQYNGVDCPKCGGKNTVKKEKPK